MFTVVQVYFIMGFFISDSFEKASDQINKIMQIIVLAMIPGMTVVMLILLTPVFSCCCCVGQRCSGLHKRVTSIAQHIFCFLEKKGSNFIIYGYRAPVCYTYYLLFMGFIMCVHCFCNFWDTAFHDNINYQLRTYGPLIRHLYCIDVFNVTKKFIPTLSDTENLTCIELRLQEGLENAGTTFGFSALSVAIVTWLLLSCTKGSRAKKQCTPCCCIRIPIVIISQIVGLILPRIIIFTYLIRIQRFDRDAFDPYPAITNNGDLFSLVAISDAVSLSMLTPWLCFEKEVESATETEGNDQERIDAKNKTFEMV